MIKSDVSLSDGDTDTSSNDFNWKDVGESNPGILQLEWDAIEEALYSEESTPIHLKPLILNECRLWKEYFPYLRVRGKRIENPLSRQKQLLRQHVLNKVVDQIVNKLNSGVMELSDGKLPKIINEQSYFERGKSDKLKHPANEEKQYSSHSPNEKTSTAKEIQKAPPRGILKNSPNRSKAAAKIHERRIHKESTSQKSFRSSSLPRISSKNNNWLARAEKHGPGNLYSSRQLPKHYQNNSKKQCTCGVDDKQLILPILTPSDIKRL